MKLKLDENFDVRLAPALAAEGFEVDTVLNEVLSASPDQTICETCKTMGRTLVTLDLDYSNPVRFPPANTEGIIVVRPPQALLPMIRATMWSVLPELRSRSVQGKLWIVDRGGFANPIRAMFRKHPERGELPDQPGS